MKNNYKFSIIVAFLMINYCLKAQDAHLSQYDVSPILLNPALTGMKNDADFSIGANYRTQWGAINQASFTTTGLSFDAKYNARWGVGAYATNSDLGGFINSFNFMLSGSYQITDPLQQNYKITTGLQAGVLYKRIIQDEFTFDSQFENGNFNADKPSGETFNKSNLVNPDFNWGIAYIHSDKNLTINPYAGISLFHLTMPKESFTEASGERLPIRWSFNGGAKFKVNDRFIIDGRMLFLLQKEAKEFNFGALTYYTFEDKDYQLVAGIDIRWNDAVITNVGLIHKNILYRLSYDYNTSSLNNFSSGRGGTEFSVIYSPYKRKTAVSYQ